MWLVFLLVFDGFYNVNWEVRIILWIFLAVIKFNGFLTFENCTPIKYNIIFIYILGLKSTSPTRWCTLLDNRRGFDVDLLLRLRGQTTVTLVKAIESNLLNMVETKLKIEVCFSLKYFSRHQAPKQKAQDTSVTTL